MKLRIATGVGLLLFMATLIGGPVRVSQAQNNQGVTLASLAGKFSARGNGFVTVCFDSGFSLVNCASSPTHVVPFNFTQIRHITRDAAGTGCAVVTQTNAPVFGTIFPAGVITSTTVFTTTSFDPTTGSGTTSFSEYHGGSCIGAAFDGGGTQTGAGTAAFVVSDLGNRIETITTSFSAVTSPFNSVEGSVQGDVFSQTAIRQ